MKLSGKEIKACLAAAEKDGWELMNGVIPQKSVNVADLEDDAEYDTDNIPYLAHKHFANPLTFEEACQDFMSKRRTEKIHRKAQPVQAIVEDGDHIKDLAAQIFAHQHACMSGARFALEAGTASNEPKHVRNGIDSALVSCAAMFNLLKKKGIITEIEYLEAMAEAWETEHRRYEKELSDHYGRNVTLG